MSKKDLSEKKLEAYADVFADIFNVLLFKKELIKPEQLLDGPTESVYKAEEGELHGQYRDTLKYYKNTSISIASMGIENQSTIDRDMPIRIMGYDYASYRSQILNGNERFPAITIVLNFSNEKWNVPKNLKGILDIPKELEAYVQDYQIYVFDIAYLEQETVAQFKSTFKHVAHLFTNKRVCANYQPLKEEIEHLEAFLDLLTVFTKDDTYKKIRSELVERKKKGEMITMCEVVERFKKEGFEEGEKKGFEEGVKANILTIFKKGKSAEEISELLDLPLQEVQNIIESFQKSE